MEHSNKTPLLARSMMVWLLQLPVVFDLVFCWNEPDLTGHIIGCNFHQTPGTPHFTWHRDGRWDVFSSDMYMPRLRSLGKPQMTTSAERFRSVPPQT